ncbi:LysR substrate-binding domain-containing protein [Oharaeibacter diazotrophicus]|uniref:LysR family glycine cleavage system transcriptional activator n=1 Tax=Oharaeibacter diazotrophicus TaxID=1920512 RepID=A0A4R6RAF9_9HYPH|nr:LysR substrate-binding domain-containing protein [Oharaeibacter diazotrophicus]TDP82627.1 LysR family glycine cleavage system transcriptional activator [Oharaeibacter diazotrophicus]BBE72609.1 glycine cleavage system transcriptional activator [Pleomorphomonas sp. SM30]GLS76643.1 transcriptional regulator [Oharaeibacter diazotrophicus]
MVTRRLPSLNALRAFEAAARLGALNRAADELSVTESAVSRQIRVLEDELGVGLFRRVHRGVRLSPAGERLASALGQAFETIRRGVDEVRKGPAEIRVRVLPTLGTRWLLPRLSAFESAHPDLKVRVSVLWESMTPDDVEHDVGIVMDENRWPPERLIALFRERLTPVCSPAYLKRIGRLDTPAALRRALLLHCSGAPDWPLWLKQAGFPEAETDGGEWFDTMDMALRAAERGRGVAIADLAMVADDLTLGRLVRASGIVVTDRTNYHVVRRDTGRARPEVDRFVDWLLAEAAATDQGDGETAAVTEEA